MRTFQFSDAKSHKFWNIEVTGTSFTVTYGKIGTNGQSQSKTFATPEKAQSEADKLVREKTGKGYVETTPQTASSDAESLEKAIRANPHDVAAISAYADYLMEQNDPRGEFMQVQIALENDSLSKDERKKLQTREKALLKKHEKEWVGDWADHFNAPTNTEGRGQINHTGGRKYEFKRGFLTTVHFGELTVNAARAIVKAPQTRFVHELFIGDHRYEDEYDAGSDIPEGGTRDNDFPGDHILLRWPQLQHVRRFQYGWESDEVYGDFCHFQCHLADEHIYDFVKQMPNLEELLVFAHFQNANKLVALPMPNLRILQLYHGWSYPLEKLAKNPSLTKLTHLWCHPHALNAADAEPYIRLPQLRAICRSRHLSFLTHLRLRLTDFGDEGVREIIDSGIMKRLHELDLRHGGVTDEGARLLAGCPDLKNLQFLDLSRNGLTQAGKDVLQATKLPIALEHQHAEIGDQDSYGDRPRYLFEGDYE